MIREETRGLCTRRASEAKAVVHSHGHEAGVEALLLFPHTSSRTLRPVHEAWAAALHMLGEVMWHLIQLPITATTEECDP